MVSSHFSCFLDETESQKIAEWAAPFLQKQSLPFATAQKITAKLGASYENDTDLTRFGFWLPDLVNQGIEDVWLVVLRPLTPLNLQAESQTVTWHRLRLPLLLRGEFAWGVVAGLQAGDRTQVGDFYHVAYQRNGRWHTILDPFAWSVPFGGKAPAELVNMARLDADRPDRAHFARLDTQPDPDGTPRVQPPTNILQLHVNTASQEGTLAGLSRVYETIAAKLSANELLTPAEQNYIGYDAVQLMPIEPTIEHEAGSNFWELVEETEETVTTILRLPDMTNWGYDVLTVASPAPNPCVLGSKRPHELIDFIATLHNFPGKPIKVIFDIVYGHTDNQTLPYLNHHFFAGPNMYGQNLQYRHPMVRAILLEMQKRKNDFGVDGVRVDGAQDFKWWDPQTDSLHYDDDYLQLMNDLVQQVAGVRYRPWMIFEDGRPWPREDWELASSYREVTRQLPNVVQWGPLTFAHNTPFLFTFWANKWWRIREIMEMGSHWITGCANHDTLRRGTQVDPEARVNSYLGQTLPEIYQKGYDNPAAKLFDYVLSPGVPMDFINAAMRAPWSFIRNTDDLWGVKVVSEEAFFLTWAVTEARFARSIAFPRLKQLGFTELAELRRFLQALDGLVKMTNNDLPVMASLLTAVEPAFPGGKFTAVSLKQFARAWMDDVHDYCNVIHWQDSVSSEQAAFNLAVREFRRERPYLQQNLGDGEEFGYLHPTEGTVLFYGLRRSPNGREQLLFAANMEGAPKTIIPTELPLANLPRDGWELCLKTPGLSATAAAQPITLQDSEGVVFMRQR